MDFLAIGNNEPLPENLPEELKELLRESRTEAGFCDHGEELHLCKECRYV